MSKAKIPEHEQFEIVAHIRDAKDKRKQLQIEADLYCISVMQVKEILKAHGFNLRKLNGANLMKKAETKEGIPVGIGDDNQGEAWTPAVDEKSEQVETEAEQAQQWEELAIPPISVNERNQRPDIEAIKQYVHELTREKKDTQQRLIEIDAELLMYNDFCKHIIEDIKVGGIEV